jgi:hypothetical protein
LVNDGAHAGVILGHLRGEILLALEQRGDVALKLDEFAGDGLGGTGAEQASGKRASKNGGAENGDMANTHEQSS